MAVTFLGLNKRNAHLLFVCEKHKLIYHLRGEGTEVVQDPVLLGVMISGVENVLKLRPAIWRRCAAEHRARAHGLLEQAFDRGLGRVHVRLGSKAILCYILLRHHVMAAHFILIN